MRSSCAAGLATALAMSLSAGVAGVANAQPTASPESTPPPTTLLVSNTGARLNRRCMTGTVICASKSQHKLWMVQNGRILITLDARFGLSLIHI